MIQAECLALVRVFEQAAEGPAEYAALGPLYDYFVREAQPTWEIGDHRGPIAQDARGMARLPLDTALSMITHWLASLIVAEPKERPEIPDLHLVESDAPTAVDAVIPPGPLNREIKRQMRRRKAA